MEVPTPELVPGDLVELAAGDVVPAAVRLVDVHGLRVNEAALTGESESTAKTADTLAVGDGALVVDRHNMVFKGTAVTYGRAQGVVVATGMGTELGRIAALLRPDDRALTAAAEATADTLADAGYRVLALAERHAETLVERLHALEHDLHLLGLVAIADPPRRRRGLLPERRDHPVMITDDPPPPHEPSPPASASPTTAKRPRS